MSAHRQTPYPIDRLFVDRWSPRSFTDEELPESTLLSFFEAARWAPSAFNIQPWRFIYALRGGPGWILMLDSLAPFNRHWAVRCAALVLVISKEVWLPNGKTQPEVNVSHAFDAGAAWAQFALQAFSSGWHAHGMGGFDKAQVALALGVPEGYAVHAVAAVGRMGDRSLLPESLQAREVPSDRLPLSGIVARDCFTFDR